MKAHTVAPGGCAHTHTSSGWIKRWLPLAFAALASPMFLSAQESAPVAGADKQTIQMLMQRIEKLEARVAQLEGTRGATAQVQAAAATAQEVPHASTGPAAGPAEEPAQAKTSQAQASEPEQEMEHLE